MSELLREDRKDFSYNGGQVQITIPIEWARIMGVEDAEEIVTELRNGKHGTFFTLYFSPQKE